MKVVVFLAANLGKSIDYENTVKQLAKEMYKRHFTLIYGGGEHRLDGITCK